MIIFASDDEINKISHHLWIILIAQWMIIKSWSINNTELKRKKEYQKLLSFLKWLAGASVWKVLFLFCSLHCVGFLWNCRNVNNKRLERMRWFCDKNNAANGKHFKRLGRIFCCWNEWKLKKKGFFRALVVFKFFKTIKFSQFLHLLIPQFLLQFFYLINSYLPP